MAETIIDGTLLNAQNIKFSAPKANASGGKSVNILNKATNTGLRVAIPLMLQWGAQDFIDEKTGKGNGKYEMGMQFPSEEYKNPDTTAFLENFQALEKKIKEDAITYSKEWFGKVHKSEEVINALWTPMLKYSKDKSTGEPDLNKAPTFRVKIPIWEGSWKCEIYDEDGNALFPSANPTVSPLDYLQKGTSLAAIIQCGGLWFANGKFGITWKLVQAVVQKPRASLSGQCFIKLKPADKDRLKVAAPAIEESDAVEGGLVEDSDVEEEAEAEEEDEVVPPPAPVPVAAPVPVPVPEPVAAAAPEPVPKKKVVKKKVVAE
jgi:hypothetical protein